MAGQNNTENEKIDIHISGRGENNMETEKIDIHIIGEGKNNTETRKLGIRVNGEGKIKCTVQDGERECLLEGNSLAESWIDQIKQIHTSGKHKERKTSACVSIYRVPECIKKIKREAYDPSTVFLGPYHHKKNQQPTAMDEYKLQTVDRTVQKLPVKNIEWLVSQVKELEKEIRDCYEDSAIDWDGDTLAWMMAMDACFILEFLEMKLPNSSLIFEQQRRWSIQRREIASDILKLENQIPFIIVRKIADSANGPRAVRALAYQLSQVGWYFRGYPFSVRKDENPTLKLRALIEKKPRHLLDLSRQVIEDFFSNSGYRIESENFSSKSGPNCSEPAKWSARLRGACWTAVSRCLRPSSAVNTSLIPSAEKLQRAGIKLKPNTGGKFHFQPRYFRHSILFVPQIFLDDDTEIFLRNLVAFEECQERTGSPIKRVISNNMWIMDQLVDSVEDVKLFVRADIIKTYLGTADEVAKIFNDLCIGITQGEDFEPFFKMVNEHYKSQLNVLISQFRKEHCSKPWYIIPIVGAIFLLLMALLQTIYTIKSYFRS